MGWRHSFLETFEGWSLGFVAWWQRYRTSKLLLFILIITMHTFLLIWASVNSFVYTGCLENELLCPQVFLVIQGTDITTSFIPEWPYLLLIILLSAVNLTLLFTLGKTNKVIYTILGVCAAIFIFSTLFVRVKINFEAAVMHELERLQLESVE